MKQTNPTPILSSNQSNHLHHTFYEPVGEVKATLLVVHGMCEHSARYDAFANYLAQQGIAVITYDQLGHGKTVKTEKELGFFDANHPIQVLLKDVVIMAETIAKRHPNAPHFIMGHSMGSFIVRNFIKHHSTAFSGVILMGTTDTNFLAKPLIPIFASLNKLAANRPSQWAANTMNTQLNMQLKKSERVSKYAWLCKNTKNRMAYEADPLCGFTFTHNGFLTLFSLMDSTLNNNWYHTLPKNYPLMLVSGQNDPVSHMGKGIKKLSKRLLKDGMTNVKTNLYPNMRHEPLNEDEYMLVYKHIVDWILVNR